MTMIIEPEGEADFPDAVEDVRKTGSFLSCRIASLTFISVLFYTYLFIPRLNRLVLTRPVTLRKQLSL